MVRPDLLKHQTGKHTARMQELITSRVSVLAALLRCPAMNTSASAASRRLRVSDTERRRKTARSGMQIGVKDDILLMTVTSERRQRQLRPLRYVPARHRTCEHRYFREYYKTFNTKNVCCHFDFAPRLRTKRTRSCRAVGVRRIAGPSSAQTPRASCGTGRSVHTHGIVTMPPRRSRATIRGSRWRQKTRLTQPDCPQQGLSSETIVTVHPQSATYGAVCRWFKGHHV
jgi:hypothetical protein